MAENVFSAELLVETQFETPQEIQARIERILKKVKLTPLKLLVDQKAFQTSLRSAEKLAATSTKKIQEQFAKAFTAVRAQAEKQFQQLFRNLAKLVTQAVANLERTFARAISRIVKSFSQITEAARKAAASVARSLADSLRGVEVSIARAGRAFSTLATEATKAFRQAGTAKDAFRRNLQALARDIRTAETALRRLGTQIKTTVGKDIKVRVIPVIDRTKILSLPPVSLPVIPKVSKTVTIPPLTVPVIPNLATNVTLEPLVVPVIPDLVSNITIEPLVVPIIPVIPRVTLEPLVVPVIPILPKITAQPVGVPVFPIPKTLKVPATLDVKGGDGGSILSGQGILKGLEPIDLSKATGIKGFIGNLMTAQRGSFGLGQIFSDLRAKGSAAFGGIGNAVKNFFGAFRNGARDVDSGFAKIAIGQRKTHSLFQDLISVSGKFFSSAIKGFTALAGAVTFFGVKAAAETETLKTSLNGLSVALGFPEGSGEEIFATILDFAKRTPFEVDKLTTSVIKLSGALNLDLGEAIDVLTILGNAGAAIGATSDDIDAASLALAQIASRGKLSAQELNQISNALPNISRIKVFDIIAQKMGITREAAQALAEQGLIPAGLGIEAILQAAKEVPGATGAMDRQMGTFKGTLSTLKDTINQLLSTAFTPLLKAITGFLQPLLQNEKGLKKFSDTANSFGTALADGFKQLLPSLKDFGKAVFEFVGILVANKDNIIAIFKFIVDSATALLVILNNVIKAVGFMLTGFRAINKFFHDLGTTIREALVDQLNGAIKVINALLRAYNKIPGLKNIKLIQEIETTVNGKKRKGKPKPGDPDFIGPDPNFKPPKNGDIPDLSEFGTDTDIAGDIPKVTDFAAAFESLFGSIQDVTGTKDDLDSFNDAITDASTRVKEALKEQTEAQKTLDDLRANRSVRLARELQDAELDLADAYEAQRDAQDNITDLERQLAELRRPATANELEEATDAVTSAEIRYREALRARDALLKKTLPTEQRNINLAGLSVDQIKSKLSQIRASLAAQKQGQKQTTDEGQTAEEIADAKLAAEIALREAKRDLTDQQQALNDLNNRANLNAEEAARLQRDLDAARRDAIRTDEAAADAALRLQEIRSGGSQIDKDIKAATEALTQAQNAYNAAIDAETKARNAKTAAINAETKARNDLNKAIQAEKTLLQDIKDANFTDTENLLPQNIQQRFKEIEFAFFNANPGQFSNFAELIPALAEALLKDPKSDIRDILNLIIRRAGIQGVSQVRKGGIVGIPAFAKGGITKFQEQVLPKAPQFARGASTTGKAGVFQSNEKDGVFRFAERHNPEMIAPVRHENLFIKTLKQALPLMPQSLRERVLPILEPTKSAQERPLQQTKPLEKLVNNYHNVRETIKESVFREGGITKLTPTTNTNVNERSSSSVLNQYGANTTALTNLFNSEANKTTYAGDSSSSVLNNFTNYVHNNNEVIKRSVPVQQASGDNIFSPVINLANKVPASAEVVAYTERVLAVPTPTEQRSAGELRSVRSVAQNKGEQDARKAEYRQADLIAKAVAAELVKAGVGSGSNDIDINIAPTGNSQLDARRLAREVEQRLNRSL